MYKQTEINNQKVNFYTEGQGAPLIFLHGWGGSGESFFPLKEFLKKYYTLYILDFPGFGKSEEPKEIWDVGKYAEIVEKFVEKEKIYPVIAVGHSFGGRIIIKLASQYPHFFARIILIGSAGIKPGDSVQRKMLRHMAKIGKILFKIPGVKNLEQIAKKVLYRIAGSCDYLQTRGIMRETFKNVINEDLRPVFPKVVIPTLLIWGSKDPMTPLSDAKKMEKEMKQARLHVIKGAGHVVHKERAEEVAELIREFIKF